MDKQEVLLNIKKYSELMQTKLDIKKIILYGSYAKNTYNENSDIDLAVIVDKLDNNDWFEKTQLLFKLRRNIDFRIEPLLFEDKNYLTGFLENIEKHGQIIFEKQF